jgi:hypothetical protein
MTRMSNASSNMRPMRQTKVRTKKKYPYLFGCYIDEKFERELTRQFLDARIVVTHYKGAMLLSVLPERPKKGERHICACPSIQYPSAWLKGDDLDALIAMLRECKSVWLKAYRKAAREVVRQGRSR